MANVKFVLDADEAKAVQGFLKVVDSQKKAERGFDRVNKKASKQSELFGKFGTKLRNRLMGVVTPIAAVTAVFSDLEKKSRAAIEVMDSAAKQRSINLTVSGVTKTGAVGVRKAEEKLMTEAGLDRGIAGGNAFNVFSLFDEKDKAAAIKVAIKADPFVENSQGFMKGLGKWHSNAGREGVSIAAEANKLMMASTRSETEASQFGVEFAKAMEYAKSAGAREEVVASAIAIGSQGAEATSAAATGIRNFAKELVRQGVKPKEGYENMPMYGKFLALKDMGVTPENIYSYGLPTTGKPFTGDAETAVGYSRFYNKEKEIIDFAQQIREQESLAGTGKSFLNKLTKLRDDDPLLSFPYIKKKSNAVYSINAEKSHIYDQAAEATLAAVKASLSKEQGEMAPLESLTLWGLGFSKHLRHIMPDMLTPKPSTIGKVAYSIIDDKSYNMPYSGHHIGRRKEMERRPYPPEMLEVLHSIDKTLKKGLIEDQPSEEPRKTPEKRKGGVVGVVFRNGDLNNQTE